MNLKRYDYVTSDFQAYEFYSEGPKGEIRKLVIFDRISEIEPPIYNLAFGDVDEKGRLDDTSVSNNKDRDIILATVLTL